MCNDRPPKDVGVGRRRKVANLASPSRQDSHQLSEHRSSGARAQPPPPRAGGSWLGRTETNLPFPSGSWRFPSLLPARPCRGSGRLPPLTVPARCLPLCFRHARSRCRLSGAHCHSVSTTRLSFISQAETLALSQSGVPIHKRQPITAAL